MQKDELPDVAFDGIPSHYLTEVPLATQRSVTSAFSVIRVLWNAKIGMLQLCVRAEGSAMAYYDGGALDGWVLLPGDFRHATTGDEIVRELRRREQFNTEEIKKLGYDSVEALLKDAWPKLERQLMALVEADARKNDQLFVRGLTMDTDGSTMTLDAARLRNEKEAVAKADAMQRNRHLRPGRKSFSLTSGGLLLPN